MICYAKLCYFFTHITQHRQILLIGSRPTVFMESTDYAKYQYRTLNEAFVTQQTMFYTGVFVHTAYERFLNHCINLLKNMIDFH